MYVKSLLPKIAVFLALTSLAPDVLAYKSGDFQIWNTNYQSLQIEKSTRIRTEEEFRYGNNASELFYQHYDWSVGYDFYKPFELMLGYRSVYQLIKNKFMQIDEPYAIGILRGSWRGFDLEDRNRFEFRHFRYNSPDHFRYRNRLIVSRTFNFSTIKVAPYTSDEMFFSSASTGFNQNRFESGLDLILTKYVKTQVAYTLQSEKGYYDKWVTANVLWLKLRITL